MKEIIMYKCELCGTEYTNEKDCQYCENQHVKSEKIVKEKYDKMMEYPKKIVVIMSDGVRMVYTYLETM